MRKILVIGGVAGGASFAARARRRSESTEIVVVEKGGYVSFANCGLPYHIGGEIKERKSLLLHTPSSLKERFNLDVRVLTEALNIDRESKKVELLEKSTGRKYFESYDQLVLATGASAIVPPLPGINSEKILTLRSIEDMDRIIEKLESAKPKKITVIGAGFIGLEVIEQLHNKNIELVLIEALPQVLAPLDPEIAYLLQAELEKNGIEVLLGDGVAGFEDRNREILTKTAKGSEVLSDLVILAIGVRPESSLAKTANLKIGARGGIAVNQYLQTSDPEIWAIGDVVEINNLVTNESAPIPLAGIANRQGRLVADNIFGTKRSFKGAIGTAIARIFGLVAAVTGANEKTLKRLGKSYKAIVFYPRSHAGYYPGAEELCIKILFDDTGSRKILGVQIVGNDGVDKRIDIFATAIKSGLTVDDLADLELAYAPPFGSAKDPVNMAGMIAQNVLDGLVNVVSPSEVEEEKARGAFLLDVRDEHEVEKGRIKDSTWIPLNQLRKRLDELPKDRKIIVYCASAQRSYYADRILRQNGFQSANLTGAYKLWSQYQKSSLG